MLSLSGTERMLRRIQRGRVPPILDLSNWKWTPRFAAKLGTVLRDCEGVRELVVAGVQREQARVQLLGRATAVPLLDRLCGSTSLTSLRCARRATAQPLRCGDAYSQPPTSCAAPV